jgi:Mrp family chromosome partitioning ATPase
MDSRYSSPDAIERDLGLPILGLIADGGLGRSPGGEGRALRDEDTEALRILRSKLTLIDVDHPAKTILITSATTEEGKSTVAAGLAAAFARAGKQTLLLEGDLRVPTLAKRLQLAPSPGLSDCLVAPVDPRQSFALPSSAKGRNRNGSVDQTRPIELADLDTRSPSRAPGGRGSFDCIAAGSLSPRPAELLGSQQFKKLLGQLQEVYEVIVIDSAPLLPVADTLELVRQADCVALCLRVSKTSRKQARAARSVLEELRARTAGLVLTDVAARHGYEPYVASPYGSGWLGPVRGRLHARARAGASSS